MFQSLWLSVSSTYVCIFEGTGFYSCIYAMYTLYIRPLHVAARSGCVQVVQSLVTRGADLQAVDNEGNCIHTYIMPVCICV